MKTAGIILLVLGIMSTIGAFIRLAVEENTSFGGLAFVVLGAFLISQANKKKKEREKKKRWAEEESQIDL